MINYFKGKIEYYKKNGCIEFLDENILISWWNEWMQFFPQKGTKYNWINLSFIHISYEDDIKMGGREITITLFGFGLRIRWTHETPEGIESHKMLNKEIDNLLNNSFYAWTGKNSLNQLKNAKINWAKIYKSRKIAQLYNISKPIKIFIQ